MSNMCTCQYASCPEAHPWDDENYNEDEELEGFEQEELEINDKGRDEAEWAGVTDERCAF